MPDLLGHTILPALSLWEPWASLMIAGVKHHETRHWPTRVRGRVGIHAAKTTAGFDDAPWRLTEYVCPGSAKDRGKAMLARTGGHLIGVADLIACTRTEELDRGALPLSDYESGNYTPRRFAFRYANVRPLLEPIPLVGRQAFFNWEAPRELDHLLGPVVDQAAAAEAYRWATHLRAGGDAYDQGRD